MRPLAIRIAGLATGLVLGTAAVGVAASQSSAQDVDGPHAVNAAGETFGLGTVPVGVDPPDLILARGLNGVIGYVRATDLDGPEPSSPDEAVAMSNAPQEIRTIPIYLSDGVTVVGEFEILPGNATSDD